MNTTFLAPMILPDTRREAVVSMRVCFRCDASLEIGTGHVMRCLTLAEALRKRGADCFFVSRQLPGNLIDMVRSQGFEACPLPMAQPDPVGPEVRWQGQAAEVDAQETLSAIGRRRVDWLVVDQYSLDVEWELSVRSGCERLMVIDDLADREHDCDLLLDQNYGRLAADYEQIVPRHCRILTGSHFALLRPEFEELRAWSLARRRPGVVDTILIAMGGVDRDNATGEALCALKAAPLRSDCRISVVVGPHAPWLAELREQANSMPWPTDIHVGISDISRLMAESDVAIGSGGGGTYERIFMGLPSILRPIADNQVLHLEKMASHGLFQIYRSPAELVECIRTAIQKGLSPPPPVVKAGATTVCEQMEVPRIVLSPVEPLDLRRTFRWLQDEELRRDFLMAEAPLRHTHFEFWRRMLASAEQRVFAIRFCGMHVGNAGLRNISVARDEAEFWLYVGERRFRGRGIGAEVVDALENVISTELGIGTSVLHVSEANAPAIALYSKAGYSARGRASEGAAFGGSDAIRMEKRL